MESVCSQEERACLMLSHGEESGRDSDEWREARGEDGPHCPVLLMRTRGCGTLLPREKKEDGEDRMRQRKMKKWGGKRERRRKRQDRDTGRMRRGTGEGEGRCSKVVRGKGVRK